MRSLHTLTCCLLIAVWTPACRDSDTRDPIASLTTGEASATFGAEYWSTQSEDATETWQDAVHLCAQESHSALPNCRTVNQLRFVQELRRTAERTSRPYDGKSGPPLPEVLVLEPTPELKD